jgi:hypothetical protein
MCGKSSGTFNRTGAWKLKLRGPGVYRERKLGTKIVRSYLVREIYSGLVSDVKGIVSAR